MGPLSLVPGRSPALASAKISSLTAGTAVAGVAEQVVHGAGGDVAVVALLLGRADDELAVLAGHEVEVVALDDRADGVREEVRDVPRVPQAEDLALDRADRGADLVRHPVEGAGGVAGGDDDVPRGERRSLCFAGVAG